MTKNQRYTPNSKPEQETEPVQHNRPDEIVTGIPASDDLPPGSPQFAAFEKHVEELGETSQLGATEPGYIEDRDKRGDAVVDGKYVERMPIHEVDALAEEMSSEFANNVERTNTQLDGNTLTVTIQTKHGTSKASAEVKDWTKSGVKAALSEIKDKMNGKNTDDTDNPDKKLADAVRAAVKP